MKEALLSWVEFSQPHRKTFGHLAGSKLALEFRRLWQTPKGNSCPITVPGIAHPIYLRAGASDDQVFHQIFLEEELDFPLPHPPQFIVDAGANIGLSSIYLANRYPQTRIVALEIEASNFALLQKNTAPYPQITPVLKGLWSHHTSLQIANPEDSHWAFTAAEATNGTSSNITAVSVSDVMQEFGMAAIDLLKIDIEGGEVEVFGTGTESWIERVGTMAIELHDRFRPGCSETLHRAIAGRGFQQSQRGEYVILTRN
ncbi:MAG TPA: FkbM family methyltransferase [Blastocatellia bacterium]|nr:FkbM family methyltransferase [Blastocatellia bacterium]